MPRFAAGVIAPTGILRGTGGAAIPVPDPEHVLHLHFSRFADCPICNLHVAEMRRRHAELVAAGIRQVAIFHSPPEQVLIYRGDLPFDLVADPSQAIYRQFGVRPSRRALLHPRAVRRLIAEAQAGNRAQEAHGGIHGRPADFLIDPAGRVILSHYGRHADDALPVQRVIEAAAGPAGRR